MPMQFPYQNNDYNSIKKLIVFKILTERCLEIDNGHSIIVLNVNHKSMLLQFCCYLHRIIES